ncbi:MAG: GatB/YqeY domain-containing protein [Burkholderiales bacterium]
MTLKERISEDMKAAMRARDAARLSAVRLLLAALKQKEVDERVELSDADVLGIIEKMVKQRRESIVQYEKAARADLAGQEKFEIDVLQAYLPQQMPEAEVVQAVAAAIVEAGASGVKDMGKVMALLKARLAGKTDMGKVSALVKARLGTVPI